MNTQALLRIRIHFVAKLLSVSGVGKVRPACQIYTAACFRK